MLEQKTHSDDSLPTCILCNDMVISLQYEQQKPCWLDGFPGITCGLELQSVSEKKTLNLIPPPFCFGVAVDTFLVQTPDEWIPPVHFAAVILPVRCLTKG